MRADDGRKNNLRQRGVLGISWRVWLVTSISLLIVMSVFLGWHYYQRYHQVRTLSAYLHSFQFTRDAMQLASAARWPKIPEGSDMALAENDADVPSIQFKFYDALRKVELPASEALPAQPAHAPQTTALVRPVVRPSSIPAVVTPRPQVPVVTAQSLAEEMAAELHQAQHVAVPYVVQVGVFQQVEAAQKLRHQLLALGYAVTVVTRTKQDKLLYCVRVGPYNSKIQATAMLKALQQQGLQGLIYTNK